MMTGGIWAQNPNVIKNVQTTMNGVQQTKTAQSNAALGIAVASAAPQMKPDAGAAPARAAAQRPGPAVVRSQPAAVAAQQRPHAAPMPKREIAPRTVIAARPNLPKKVVVGAEPVAAKVAAAPKPADPFQAPNASKAPKPEEKKWAMNGKRDPFFSPVVQQPTGSGCSTGKKCLEIGQINVRGVVKSESGFIAVVTNSLNKAYFLRESDPVFNGYVVRITGDTVVFQEQVVDKLGKPLTREVVKRIVTPAV
jgi:hypothetical protein